MVSSTYLIIAVIVALLVFRLYSRLRRQRKGTKYSLRSILLIPVVYTALTVFFMAGMPLLYDIALAATIAIGTAAGLVLGRRSEIFEQDGKVMYRRSMEIMAIWLVGFVIRIAFDFIYNPIFSPGTANAISSASTTAALAAYASSPVVFGADILLAFSAGLLLGEAIVLYRNYGKRYGKSR